MAQRPKHYDRPGKRPGPARVRSTGEGGSIIDQRGGHPGVAETPKTNAQLDAIERDLDIHGTIYNPAPGSRHKRVRDC